MTIINDLRLFFIIKPCELYLFLVVNFRHCRAGDPACRVALARRVYVPVARHMAVSVAYYYAIYLLAGIQG